ncbi:MAG: peptidoglycan DD-metalloendopeptidase family protein, partial [Bacteroidales bacterium]|nr:peptidoglycan DD-metalloendopeptidase family protein [Bacteroidales bacterium]
IENRKDIIMALDKEIKIYDQGISTKKDEISRLERRLDTLQIYHQNLVYNAYKHRDSKVWFMYIMASENIGQGVRRWSYLKNLSSSVREQATQILDLKIQLSKERDRLNNLRQESVKTQKERAMEYQKLTREETQVMNTINSLKKQEKKFRTELNKKKKEVEKLNKEIERILAEAVRQQKQAGQKVKVDYELSAKFSDNKGKLPWPVTKGVIVEKFGQSYHPVFKTVKLPFNNGVNISTDKNAKALCIFDGVVKQILVMPGYNQCVLVQHGEYFTFYCKLKKVDVKSGQTVKTGSAIGIIDDSEEGNAILHFQLWKGTDKQNPETWLRK